MARHIFDPPEWFNMADYFLDARVAEGRGARTALITPERTWSYADMQSLANRFGHLLRALGVEREQRVLVSLRDSAEYVGALFGALKIGAAVVMANPGLKADDLRYFMEYTRAKVVFAPADRRDVFNEAARDLASPPRIVFDDTLSNELGAQKDALQNEKTHRDDPALWLFSGGTTGKPKAVVQTHLSFANTTELYAKRALGYRETDVAIGVPKLFFGYATGSVIFFPFSVGASAVLFPEPPEAARMIDLVRRHRATILVNVPTFIKQMLAAAAPDAEGARAALSTLRFATSAGEALPGVLHRQWNEAFSVPLLDGLGTAEMWHIFITNRPDDVRVGSLGRVVDGFEVELLDGSGAPVKDDEIGALRVRGRSRALGYFQNLDRTANVFEGEWYRTGDMLTRSADGYFTYAGRGDDLMKVGGRWVAPGEIEDCLLKRPEVREAAVSSFKDAAGLVKPMAFVTLDAPMGGAATGAAGDALAESLKEHVRTTLEPYKAPREIVFLDAMPRTHLGKIDRGDLKRRAEALAPRA